MADKLATSAPGEPGEVERSFPERLFYIQNTGFQGNCLKWWRVDGHGYTCNLEEAWKVTESKALDICSSRPKEDIPWPADYIEASARRHVDCEVLREEK